MLTLLVLLPTPRAVAGVDDWRHTWEVIQLVKSLQGQAIPPNAAMVYYLGDSVARESVVSDEAWTEMLARKTERAGKAAALGYALAGHNETFGMDETILEELPAAPVGQPQSILLIGVGISRFIGPPTALDPVSVDPGLTRLSPWDQHHYDGRAPLSASRKRELVRRWMDRRWAGFKRNKAANVAAIGRLIRTAKSKGFRPVIVDQPLNLAVVGSALYAPRTQIREACVALAGRHGIRYLRFNRSIKLPSADFWDLHHLLEHGYKRWQARLSDELVKILPGRTTAQPRL